MIYILDNIEITNNQFICNGTTYPSNWLLLTSDEEKSKLGIISLSEVYPTVTDTQTYDGTYVDDFSGKTRTYNIINIADDANQDQKLSLNDQINSLQAQLENIAMQIQALKTNNI